MTATINGVYSLNHSPIIENIHHNCQTSFILMQLKIFFISNFSSMIETFYCLKSAWFHCQENQTLQDFEMESFEKSFASIIDRLRNCHSFKLGLFSFSSFLTFFFQIEENILFSPVITERYLLL